LLFDLIGFNVPFNQDSQIQSFFVKRTFGAAKVRRRCGISKKKSRKAAGC
jgi:hypothetical protein